MSQQSRVLCLLQVQSKAEVYTYLFSSLKPTYAWQVVLPTLIEFTLKLRSNFFFFWDLVTEATCFLYILVVRLKLKRCTDEEHIDINKLVRVVLFDF